MHFQEEYEDKSLIIMKFHHALSDGLGLIQMFCQFSNIQIPTPPKEKCMT